MCSEKYFSLVMDHHFCLPFSVSFYGNIWLYMEIYGYIYMVVYMAIYMVVYMVMDTYMIYIYIDSIYFFVFTYST